MGLRLNVRTLKQNLVNVILYCFLHFNYDFSLVIIIIIYNVQESQRSGSLSVFGLMTHTNIILMFLCWSNYRTQ